jgi:hypothetical protein
MPDDETATGFVFALLPPKPVEARHVRFRIVPRRTLAVSEVQVLDGIRYEPFDLRIALPDDDLRRGNDTRDARPQAAFEGRCGGVLRAVAAQSGKTLAERKLDAPPVFDGLIAANRRLYMSTTGGKVVCLGK